MSGSLFLAETQAFLKALASETRQQIMQEFATGAALTVGEIAARCGIGQSTASEQLTILRQGVWWPQRGRASRCSIGRTRAGSVPSWRRWVTSLCAAARQRERTIPSL